MRYCIDSNSAVSFQSFTEKLYKLCSEAFDNGFETIVFLCIGTDRSTGDSLGPLVGYKISNLNIQNKNIFVYGNLSDPVHAKNVEDINSDIKIKHEKPYIIAIDASLGRMEHVGLITIGNGSIKPGSGVNKDLSEVGDAYITGIVNFGGFMDFLVLQNTRLDTVMKLADLIAKGIEYVMQEINKTYCKSATYKESYI